MQVLKELRKENNLSLKELGIILGIAESTVSLYENEKREPDNKMLLKIANYFNVSVDYLLGRTTMYRECASTTIERLKQTKKDLNLTYKDISALSGVPLRTIEDMFAGRTKPRINTVEAIEKALGIDRTFNNEPKCKNVVNIKLRELRKEQNKTLKEVAEALGTSHQVISRYELEITQPDFETLIRIANYFNVSVDYLLGRTEIKDSQCFNNKRLLELRKSKNLTQSELAQKLNLTQQAYARYENCQREPDYKTLCSIANFFNVSVDYLLGRTDERQERAIKEKGLSENEQALIELFNCVPEDKQALVLSMIQVALKSLK